MQVFKHEGHNAYQLITNKVVIIKNKDRNKVKFWFGGLRFANFKFSIRPHKQWQYFHWLIRTPVFYWERHNCGFKIGLPNLYLWVIK